MVLEFIFHEQVLYADGDEEILNLRKERWELVGDNILPGVRISPYVNFF